MFKRDLNAVELVEFKKNAPTLGSKLDQTIYWILNALV